MNLRLKLNGATLPDGSLTPAKAQAPTHSERNAWHDSSMDLKRGLDVIELSVDLLLPELQELPTPRGC
jgi:hypothetical protein